MCQYSDLFLQYIYYLKDLIAADPNGDLDGHFQSVLSLISQFQECESIEHIRCALRYLPKKYPEINRKFKSGHFAMKN